MIKKISDAVRNIIGKDVYLQIYMTDGLINYSSFARHYRSFINKIVGKECDITSISMAARRYINNNINLSKKKLKFNITILDDMIDYNIKTSNNLIKILNNLTNLISDGNVITQTNESKTVIIISKKYKNNIENLLKDENILLTIPNLAILKLNFAGEFINTPGTIYNIIKLLYYKGINIIEIFSDLDELSLVVESNYLDITNELLQNYKI